MLSTKEEVYHYLEKISRNFSLRELKLFTANHISETLNISRNLASQYLNDLVKEKKAVKVNSRPVYFFHKKNVERSAMVVLDTCIFSGLDEFQLKCCRNESRRDFQKAVGHYLSLSTCVEQCKAAMQYPPNGLPILLYGANGTGKSFLSKLMYEYGKNESVIGKDANYVAVDCTEYAQNLEKFEKKLRGENDGKGWLSKASGGVLFFDEIDRLPSAGQELIYSYLVSGQYRGFREEDKIYESNARLVFATARPPKEALFKALARRIPIVIPVPSLTERTIDEKEEMLVSFLKDEGRRMGVDVSISQNAFHCMLNYPFENNIDELKACIASSCAGAYLKRKLDGIAIRTYHLPEYMLAQLKLESDDQSGRLIHMNSYSKDTSYEQSVQYFQLLLEQYQDYLDGMVKFEEFLANCQRQINEYYDYLIFVQKLVNMKISSFEQMINRIFENVGEMYGISLSKKYSYLLARCLDLQLRSDNIMITWQKRNEEEIAFLFQELSQNLEKELAICQRITSLIKQNLDVDVNTLNQILLILNIKSQSQNISFQETAGIILSHGYSTATSIADAANQIIGKKVFDAIDMPLDMRSQEVAALLERHIEHYVSCRNIILLVDMGSLEEIYRDMKNVKNVNVGIINNISTALAVDIGMGISNNRDMEEILRQSSNHVVCSYRVIRNSQKKDALIFSGENGIDTAEKIKGLLLQSSEAAIPMEFVAYDYYRLVRNGNRDEIFNQYHVKAIIGLFNPEIEGVPFVSLEDIISMRATEQLNMLFSDYLDEKHLEAFNRNMLKNFTLQNVVENITILNPDKVLDEVEQSVKRLQRIIRQKLEGRIMIGLYVHLCCLVERLVTKTSLENYSDLEKFQTEHGEFIAQVKECFRGISSHYKVEIPVSEIAYIYDYIHLNLKTKTANLRRNPEIGEDE